MKYLNGPLPGETVAGLTTDADDVLESDWLKLLRRSSFSRVRSPSILNDFYSQPIKTKQILVPTTTKIQLNYSELYVDDYDVNQESGVDSTRTNMWKISCCG